MKKGLYEDIPGVGELLYLREGAGAKGWLDQLAFKVLSARGAIAVSSFDKVEGKPTWDEIVRMPFLKIERENIGFSSEKYAIAGVLIPVYEALKNKTDLQLLQCLMPYDYICYFRPAIGLEKDEDNVYDADRLIRCIKESKNSHFIRMLFLLLRRCGQGDTTPWKPWIEEYISKLPREIKTYEDFTVERDARVTLTSIAGKEAIFEFVERLKNEKKLQEYERRHFIESCDTPQRAGEVLIHKIKQEGYRQDISPINIFSIRFFGFPRVRQLLNEIRQDKDKEHSQKIRDLAAESLAACVSE